MPAYIHLVHRTSAEEVVIRPNAGSHVNGPLVIKLLLLQRWKK